MAQNHPPAQAGKAGDPGHQQAGSGNRQSHAQEGENFVLVDSEQGLDIGDDLFSIGEVRRADRLPRQYQGGNAGQSRQSADDAPDVTGSTGV